MIDLIADVAILGSGFGGSLTALLCQRIGLRPVLIERGTHPRFAIGESSTPMADLVLTGLCRRYDLPRLLPLTHYGSWKRTYPELACGLKRGFSYFHHPAGEPFGPRPDHANELLVAANSSDELGDTHWFRADVDHFFVREAQAAGVAYFDRTRIEKLEPGDTWRITVQRDGSPIRIKAAFVVDATGPAGVLASTLGIPCEPVGMQTHSRAVFSHFTGVRPWGEVYAEAGGAIADHPFACDAAALHHVYDGGWMWVLRFDNGVTSAGFVLDGDGSLFANAGLSPEDEWSILLRRFPSIARQFDSARAVMPLRRTERLQRRTAPCAGPDWAMLPHTAYFLDPWFSAGNAHTLVGVERLISILDETRDNGDRATRLRQYEETLQREIDVLDRLIHGCYRGFARFDLMGAFAMFYFAAATFGEERRRAAQNQPDDAFLLAHDASFQSAIQHGYDAIGELSGRSRFEPDDALRYHEQVRRWIEPYNTIGLADLAKKNMYPYE